MSDAVNRRGQPVDITSHSCRDRALGSLPWHAHGPGLTYPLFALALAGLLSLAVRTLGDQGTTFRDHLALASHAFLILALGSLLAIVLQRITGDPDAFFTPALFLPDSASLPVRILAGIDLFTVWMLSVVSIWLGALNPGHGATRFALILLGLYLALNVATALLLR
jgi:ascorbate-specific PTS system EIIC-type component UlaA